MQEAIIEFINNFGYVGIALLIFIENIFPPIPSEVVLVFGGFLTVKTEMKIFLVILSATIGAVFGAAVLYTLGRILDKERIKKLFSSQFGKMLHLNSDDVTKAEIWFKKYEYKAVLIGRCIPVIRSLISIPAGMANMNPLPFFSLTIIGTAIWNTILVIIGAIAGDAWTNYIKYIGIYSKVALILIAIAVVILVFVFYHKKKKRR